jgi:cysteinyl-tRNA synthetase
MSKSLGNFTELSDLITQFDPRAYRLLVLRAHYRSPIEVNVASATDASAALARLDTFARAAAKLPVALPDDKVLASFVAAMDDDLDTPAAMALLFDTVRRVNTAIDDGRLDEAAGLAGAAQEIARAVGLPLHAEAGEVPDDVAALARARDEARAARDWARADAVRDELQAAGYVVEDTPSGTEVRPA